MSDAARTKNSLQIFLVLGAVSGLSCMPTFALASLSERYPGDVGIENDPAVIFSENFEASSVSAISSRWNDTKNADGMSLVADVPSLSSGSQALRMTCVGGSTTGGHLYKRLEGYEQIFARFYTKFPADSHPLHHFVGMGGYNPPTNWPQGHAGEQPPGDERFISAIETYGDQWTWDFYTYWMDMHSWRPDPTGLPNSYYGNRFFPTPPAPVQRDRWVCVELMIKLNTPPYAASFDGEQAFFIDGALAHHLGPGFPNGYWMRDKFHPDPDSPPFEGFRWRTVADLNLNFFWLSYYMTTAPPGEEHHVLFDDVVLATEYVGCHGGSATGELTDGDEGSSSHEDTDSNANSSGTASDQNLNDSAQAAVTGGCGKISGFSDHGLFMAFFLLTIFLFSRKVGLRAQWTRY